MPKPTSDGLGDGSGATPLTNLWVLTAQHCPLTINAADPSYTTEITLDYNWPSA